MTATQKTTTIRRARRRRARNGMAMVLALAMLTVLATLSVAFVSSSVGSIRKATNVADIDGAQRQAESGLAFHHYILRGLTVPADVQGQDLILAVATSLRSRLDGTATLGGLSIVHDPNDLDSLSDPNTITIPSIVTSDRTNFSATLSLSGEMGNVLSLSVTGRSGFVSRTVGVNLQLRTDDGSSFFLNHGIASKGTVRMTGNAKVLGVNDPNEANVLAATYSDNEVIDLTGNCEIDGDLSISNSEGYVSMSGNVSVGGVSSSSSEVYDHIHTGIGEVTFPEADPTVFEPFATNLVDASTSTSGDLTFTNIRIVAGTNTTFSGNITLNGVIFIEVPNDIHFSGNVQINGVIVTQDAGDDNYDQNTIKFTGNTTVQGVEALPAEPQFANLRELPGTFLLAPGFSAKFAGNFGTVAGYMAADEFKFAGNAGGTVKGGVINYGDTELRLTGNSEILIDRSDTPPIPPGFSAPGTATLSIQPGTYRED